MILWFWEFFWELIFLQKTTKSAEISSQENFFTYGISHSNESINDNMYEGIKMLTIITKWSILLRFLHQNYLKLFKKNIQKLYPQLLTGRHTKIENCITIIWRYINEKYMFLYAFIEKFGKFSTVHHQSISEKSSKNSKSFTE